MANAASEATARSVEVSRVVPSALADLVLSWLELLPRWATEVLRPRIKSKRSLRTATETGSPVATLEVVRVIPRSIILARVVLEASGRGAQRKFRRLIHAVRSVHRLGLDGQHSDRGYSGDDEGKAGELHFSDSSCEEGGLLK